MYTQAHAHMYVYTSSATAIGNSTHIVSNLVYNAYKVEVLNLSSCELPPPPPKKYHTMAVKVGKFKVSRLNRIVTFLTESSY